MKRAPAALLAAGAALLGLGAAWLAQPRQGAGPETAAVAGPAGRMLGSATADQLVAATVPSMARPSTGERDVFLQADLRFKLEALLLEAGDADSPSALKQRLMTLAPGHFAAQEVARAIALLERYVDYRVALGEIKAPKDPTEPRALRGALDARQRVREKHFDADEYQALFAQEEELDRFTLARLEIERNPDFSAAQKSAALREAEHELGESQRAARTEAVAHVAVASQSAAFDAAGLGEHERYALRRAQYGEAAAQQLAQLDREERDWQSRLDAYASEKARDLPAEQLQRLRQQLFTPEEQLRIGAALVLRQQTAKIPARP